jgi:hypothetical protein
MEGHTIILSAIINKRSKPWWARRLAPVDPQKAARELSRFGCCFALHGNFGVITYPDIIQLEYLFASSHSYILIIFPKLHG